MTIFSVTLEGPDQPRFALAPAIAGDQQIPAGGSLAVNVRASPGANDRYIDGSYSATLRVVSDARSSPDLIPIQATINRAFRNEVDAYPWIWEGTRAQMQLRLTNRGLHPFNVGDIRILNQHNQPDLAITRRTPATNPHLLAPGASMFCYVVFTLGATHISQPRAVEIDTDAPLFRTIQHDFTI